MSQPEFEYLGPYRVERTLGRGGMGTVYKGVHARSGEPIAIKVIARSVANSPRFRRRFDAEIETLQRLKHPNIVQLVGYGEEQGLLFYTMEYVDGHSLHDHLRQHTKMPWEEVVQVGIETAAALKHAHDFGIIHRDLKPANLMLDSTGHVKLTDFGIAKLFGSSDMTAAGSVIGTADYMPPEQAEGKVVTVRSDLYSLGGLLYALLVGKAPFGGKSVPEVLYAVRYNPPPPLVDRVDNVPIELCELIHQLLEKDPQKRPPTALVVGNRLKSLQRGVQKMGGIQVDPVKPENASGTERPVGTHLTSLDLSDVEDEDLRLTGEELSRMGLASEPEQEPASETEAGFNAMGTHEQQTQVAPDDFPFPPPPLNDKSSLHSRRESEFSAEFPEVMDSEEMLTSGGPSRYTPVEAKSRRPLSIGEEQEETSASIDWIQVGSMVGLMCLLLASVGFAWWMLQPESADELYQQITAAADSGDDAQLLAARSQMDEFLQRFADDERSEQVQALVDEAELSRWTRVLQRRASQAGGAEELSAIEQAFLDCIEARTEDFRVAQAKMDAFLKVFGAVDNLPRDERRLVELVEHAVRTEAIAARNEVPQAAKQLEKLIQSAEKSLAGEQLDDFYQDLLRLYSDKPWAREQMKRVSSKLQSES